MEEYKDEKGDNGGDFCVQRLLKRRSYWPQILLATVTAGLLLYLVYDMKGSALVGTALVFSKFSSSTAVPVKQEPGLGKLPAMGFNSWNAFRCDIDEDKFLTAAQKMIDLGLKDIGFEYVNIDGMRTSTFFQRIHLTRG